MDCDKFELKISSYIDGEIKQKDRTHFDEHKTKCDTCLVKFTDIQTMLGNLKVLTKLKTSQNFQYNLNSKIQSKVSKKTSQWGKIFNSNPFGLAPSYALGMTFALGAFIVSSYFLVNLDSAPELNPDVIAKYQSLNENTLNTKELFLADEESEEDTLSNTSNNPIFDDKKIIMVNSPK